MARHTLSNRKAHNMLIAIVLELVPAAPVVLPATLGRAVQAWLLARVQQIDPDLAARLHDGDGPRPYTCSDLIHGARRSGGRVRLTPQDRCWLRFTGLEDETCAGLLRATTPERAAPPQGPGGVAGEEAFVELEAGARLRVRARYTEASEHPWAGRDDYMTLLQQHVMGSGPGPARADLHFGSPTIFRSRGLHVPIPMPDLVFGSYFFRWNHFAPVSLPYEARQYPRESVAVGEYKLRTRDVRLGRVYTGFEGDVRFEFVGQDERLARTMEMLAHYAFWCGTGYRTTSGMGQTMWGGVGASTE